MSLTPVGELPGGSRAWIFGARPAPGDETADRLLGSIREFLADWAARESGDEGGYHGDTGRGAVLGDGPLGQVDVDVFIFPEFAFDF